MSVEQNEPENLEYFASRYSAIVESSDDAIISKNLHGIIETWNLAAEKIFGYTAAEAIGKPVQMLIPLGRENEEPTILARISRGERIDHYETTRRRKDGSLVEISLTVSPVKNAQGKVIGASKIVRDITDRKRTDLLQRRLSSIVESSDDAIISKDLNGIIQSWNRGAERMFGYMASEAVGQPVTILMPKERENEEPRILERIRRGDRIDHYETMRRRKDGTLLNVSLAISPIRDSGGMVVGASKIVRDITEREKARIEIELVRAALSAMNVDLETRVSERTKLLQEAMAQMQEFSYTVSHDLRSPVRAMQGYATATLEVCGSQLNEEGKNYLERIIRAGSRMEKLIHDVLIYSRLSSSTIRKQVLNLRSLIQDTLFQYEEFQISRIETIFHEPLSEIYADETLLTQALANFLRNAGKFVSAGTKPCVNISTHSKDGKVYIRIKDNGIGVRPEFQARIFGMFERAHQDPTLPGTGVGLAIARRAIEKMGGKTGVESDGVNGSTFWIELPEKF